MPISVDTEEQLAQLAREDRMAKAALRVHLVAFFSIISALCLVNIVLFPGYYWVLWLAAGWGISVIAHAVAVFAFTCDVQGSAVRHDEAAGEQ
jgi:hypothetical protein